MLERMKYVEPSSQVNDRSSTSPSKEGMDDNGLIFFVLLVSFALAISEIQW